jgi:hypothetical protein
MREVFLNGCDINTEWQLPWFIHNFERHNEGHLIIADFGMSEEMLSHISMYQIIEIKSQEKGWFKKPRAILTASRLRDVDKVCWLDTDCEIKGNIEHIFDLSEPNKLGMVEDRPWTARRNEMGKWYNSGVVLVEGTPTILGDWASNCVRNPVQGDQEVLYFMMGGDELKKLAYINPLPHTYNTLRIDYQDGIAVRKPLIVHHTGEKGNQAIRKQMNV